MEQFPPNSHKARAAADRGPKRVERVTSGDVRRRKQPLGTRFRQTFFTTDARTALDYMIINSIVPAAKEMMLDAVNSAMERLIHGDHRPGRRSPGAYPLGRVDYGGMSRRGPEPRAPAMPQAQILPRASRMRHAFDEIVISSRQEAEEVLDRMYDIISRHEAVTVADLYELTGIASSHTDNKWGWEDLHGSGVGRVRGGGYLLELPEPISLV